MIARAGAVLFHVGMVLLLAGCSGPAASIGPSATPSPIATTPVPGSVTPAFPLLATPIRTPTPILIPTATPSSAPASTVAATPTAAPREIGLPNGTPHATALGTKTTPAQTVDQGVHTTGADAWQAAGLTGAGVRVGVIDTSFNDYQRLLAGATVSAKSFRRDGLVEDPSDEDGLHGTACAEIVHAMAPDAALFLATAGGGVTTFGAAVEWLVRTAHVSIISLSFGPTGYPIDDTSEYAQIIDHAKDAGVFFVVAAGNDGAGKTGSRTWQGHYSAVFSDTNGDGFHDFVPPQGGNATDGVSVHLDDDPFTIVMNWDDWAQPHVNLLIYLYVAAGNEVARADTSLSRRNNEPEQFVDGKLAAGTYTLKVRKPEPTDANLRFDIHFDGVEFAQITPAGSIEVPADARGAVAVGEADWETDEVYITSARGPTKDGRPKPEFVGPACVTSATYASTDDDEFCGTSAAAPHVAGAAALVWQAFPDSTPDSVLTYLRQHAKKLTGGDADPDVGGAGRVDLGPPPVR
jgi:subtilisin family serine protease